MGKKIRIIGEENNIAKYGIFCTFDSELTNKSYVIFYNKENDENGKKLLEAGVYQEKDGYLNVDKNLTHEENEMISDVMQNMIKNVAKLKLGENNEKKMGI